MKKVLNTFILICLFCFLFLNTSAYADTATPPEINAEGSTLMDVSTGEILFDKNGDKQFEPASTTKIITALVTLDKCNLDDEVTVTEDFTKIDGTTIGLLKGDVLTVRDLLLGMLLESGNDCADALAIHISGSIDEFAKLMNKKATDLGAKNTNFKNPSGLPDPEHLTTPNDLALFMKEFINNKELIDISTTNNYTITMKNNSSRTILVNNKNYMINKNSRYFYQYAVCGKNGYTTKSNHTYVSAAEKDGHILVASFLDALDKNKNFYDMATVFNYGFDNFSYVPIYKKEDKVTDYKVTSNLNIPLLSSDEVDYVVPKGDEGNVTSEIKVENKDLSKTSFNLGDKILKGTVYVNGKEYKEIDLEAGESREYISPLESLSANKFKPVVIIPAIIIGVIVGLGVYINLPRRKKLRKKRFQHLKKTERNRIKKNKNR